MCGIGVAGADATNTQHLVYKTAPRNGMMGVEYTARTCMRPNFLRHHARIGDWVVITVSLKVLLPLHPGIAGPFALVTVSPRLKSNSRATKWRA